MNSSPLHPVFLASGAAQAAVPITFVSVDTWPAQRLDLPPAAQAYADASGFEPKPGRHVLLPSGGGGLSGVVFGIEADSAAQTDVFRPGSLVTTLPEGVYRFANAPHDARLAALAFALGSYRFARYRAPETHNVRLELPAGVDGDELTRITEGVLLARELIDTPSNDMGPAELETAARDLAGRHGAAVQIIVGDDLLRHGFGLIHAVGSGSARAPRLIDLTWGKETDPKVTLVGKGVCFDTGGLDLKNEAGMLNMKKDMGGAACVLALAHMLMSRGAKLRLRVLIPAVENAVSGRAFRPRDVYRSRKGITVEIGNTDAEGRLILADALAFADEEAPELIVDMATLTGAARVALGPDLPALFTDDDALAGELMRAGTAENDPLWRLPLWRGYESMLESKVADTNNVASGTFGGAITAALFLRRFVERAKSYAHFDIFAWTQIAKPGRPEGGECQVSRALYAVLSQRYG